MKDYWEGRFEPAAEAEAYGVRAMRRRCCICGAMPLVGCAARRERMDRKAAIERAAKERL